MQTETFRPAIRRLVYTDHDMDPVTVAKNGFSSCKVDIRVSK